MCSLHVSSVRQRQVFLLVQSSDIKQAHGVVEVAAEALDREVEAVLKRLATHPVVCPTSESLVYVQQSFLPLLSGRRHDRMCSGEAY